MVRIYFKSVCTRTGWCGRARGPAPARIPAVLILLQKDYFMRSIERAMVSTPLERR